MALAEPRRSLLKLVQSFENPFIHFFCSLFIKPSANTGISELVTLPSLNVAFQHGMAITRLSVLPGSQICKK